MCLSEQNPKEMEPTYLANHSKASELMFQILVIDPWRFLKNSSSKFKQVNCDVLVDFV